MNVDNKRRFRSSYVAGDWNSLKDVVGLIETPSDSKTKANCALMSEIDEAVAMVNGAGKNTKNTAEEEDWCVVKPGDAVDHEENRQFDLILTAETCYTEKSCQQVAQHLLDMLKADFMSVGLVASKRFYFGTGGSAAYFRECCTKLNDSGIGAHELQVEVVEVIDDGKSNIREIMLVRKVRRK